jgi:hypothetical protein
VTCLDLNYVTPAAQVLMVLQAAQPNAGKQGHLGLTPECVTLAMENMWQLLHACRLLLQGTASCQQLGTCLRTLGAGTSASSVLDHPHHVLSP